MDGSDPKSDPRVATHTTNRILATHTTNGISTQKLLINPTIQAVFGPITPIIAAGVVGVRESLSPLQTVLLQSNVTDAVRNCARIYRTPEKVSGTERYGATPRDLYSSETNSIFSFQIPSFIVTSVSPAHFRDQYIVSPRHPSSIVKRVKSAEPFDARINGSPAKTIDSTSFFSHVMVLEAISGEFADIDASKRMNFASNSVLGETPKFVDLRISTVNTADKLDSVFAPVTRAEVLMGNSKWLVDSHSIVKVTAHRVSEAKGYRYYIKNSGFETRNFFERGNIQLTRQDLTRQDLTQQYLTQPENIQITRSNEKIPLTRLNENSPLTRPTEFSENEKEHVPDNPDP